MEDLQTFGVPGASSHSERFFSEIETGRPQGVGGVTVSWRKISLQKLRPVHKEAALSVHCNSLLLTELETEESYQVEKW